MHNRPLLFAEFTPIKHLKHIYLARLYQLTSCIENQPARGTMLCVVILLVLYLPPSLGFTAEVVKNLTKLIFDTNAYDSSLRPASNQMYPTDLKVSFDLISINKLDELEEKLVTTTYLILQWKDEFLTWDTAGFRVKKIPLPQNAVWKPDFVLKNGFTEFRELGGPFYYVVLAFDGTIIWKPYQVFESQCSIDVTYFPFDRRMCNIQFTLYIPGYFEFIK